MNSTTEIIANPTATITTTSATCLIHRPARPSTKAAAIITNPTLAVAGDAAVPLTFTTWVPVAVGVEPRAQVGREVTNTIRPANPVIRVARLREILAIITPVITLE